MITSKYVIHVCSPVQSMCQSFIKRHSSKGNKIKRVIKEGKIDKLLFGPIVETKAQKKKRLKLEKKGMIPHEEENTINTELLWIMENSRNKLKKIPFPKPRDEQLNDKDQSSVTKLSEMECKSSTDQKTKNLFHSESNQITQEMGLRFNTTSNLPEKDSNTEVALSNSNESDSESTTTKYMSSSVKKLPDIVIKNLPSFPITMGNKQETSTQSTEILSISGRDDLETIKFPSVTKILTQSMSQESKLALEAWKERMIQKLGQEGFEMHQKGI